MCLDSSVPEVRVDLGPKVVIDRIPKKKKKRRRKTTEVRLRSEGMRDFPEVLRGPKAVRMSIVRVIKVTFKSITQNDLREPSSRIETTW